MPLPCGQALLLNEDIHIQGTIARHSEEAMSKDGSDSQKAPLCCKPLILFLRMPRCEC